MKRFLRSNWEAAAMLIVVAVAFLLLGYSQGNPASPGDSLPLIGIGLGLQQRIKRVAAKVPVTDNGTPTVDMPRNYDYESIYLRLYGGVQVTTNFASVRPEAPIQAFKRLELVLNGQTNVYSKPGTLARVNPFRSQLGFLTPPSGFVVATYQVEAALACDLALIDGLRPKDSNLRSAGLAMFQKKFTFGAAADLFTGAGVGIFTNTLFADVMTSEVKELPDDKGLVTSPIYLTKRSWLQFSPAAANANLKLPLPVGNYMRGVIIRCTNAGDPSDAVLNNIILNSGVDVRYNMTYLDARAQNRLDYEQAVPTGFVVADLMSTGAARSGAHANDAWDLTDPKVTSEASLTLDTNGGAGFLIDVEVIEMIKLG
jgi:hypothetical protein